MKTYANNYLNCLTTKIQNPMKTIIYGFILCLMALGCGSKKKSNVSVTERATEPLPEPISDPTTGTTSDPSDTNDTLPELPTFEPIPKLLDQPTEFRTDDIKTYTIEEAATVPNLKVEYPIVPFKGLHLRSYRNTVPVACQHVFPAMNHATDLSITVDGDISDWNSQGLIGIDRSGDALSTGHDLRFVSFAINTDGWYFAVELSDNWPTDWPDDSQVRVNIQSYVPSNTSDTEEYKSEVLEEFVVDGFGLYVDLIQNSPGRFVNDHQSQLKDNILEFLIPSKYLPNGLDGAFFVSLDVRNDVDDNREVIGGYYVGVPSDYTCVVKTPYTQKYLRFYREDGIDPKLAESDYRALANAAPIVEEVLGKVYEYQDSISLIVNHKSKSYLGRYMWSQGIATIIDPPAVIEFPISSYYEMKFDTMAHEYGHGFNASDWGLDLKVYLEGHSNMLSQLARESYYGRDYAQNFLLDAIDKVLNKESEVGSKVPIGNNDVWDTHEQFSVNDFYNKSHLFLESLSIGIARADLFALMSENKSDDAWAVLDTSFDRLIASNANLNKDILNNGWFNTNAYDTGIMDINEQLKDSDGDGLVLYQEIALQTDPNNRDTDGDMIADGIEFAISQSASEKNDHSSIFVDHHLAEWDAIFPEAFRNLEFVNPSTCDASRNITKAGVLLDGQNLLAGVQIGDANPEDTAPTRVGFFIFENGGQVLSMNATRGERGFALFRDGFLKLEPTITRFTGKDMEFFVEPYTFPEKKLPQNFTWQACSYLDETICHCTLEYKGVIRVRN